MLSLACAPEDDGVLTVDAAQSVAEQEAWVDAAYRINEAAGTELLRLEVGPCELWSRGCLSTVDHLENAWGVANHRLRYGVASREGELFGGVYLHELGHLLGLGHTDEESAMHSPSFDCWGRWELEQLGFEGPGECESSDDHGRRQEASDEESREERHADDSAHVHAVH